MNWWRKIRRACRALFRKAELDQELDEEMRAHLAIRAQGNVDAGMPPEEARGAALRSFGGMEQVKEVCWALRGIGWIENLWRDVRFAWRVLFKNRAFTAVAVLTLGLGVGANTAVFTLIDALFLRSLPGVRDAQQLLVVSDKGATCLPYAPFQAERYGTRSLSGLCCAAAHTEKRRLTVAGSGGGSSEPVCSQAVSGNFFSVLGASAALGRLLAPEDDLAGDPQAVVVISYGFWQRRLGLSPTAVGQTITLDDVPFTIVGVAPRDFFGFIVESRPDLWWPMHMIPRLDGPDWAELFTNPTGQWVEIFGRLKPGAPAEQARAELDVGFKQLLGQEVANYAQSDRDRHRFLDHRIELQSGAAGYSGLRGQLRSPFSLLMMAAGLVLLVACANLAGLLLARGAARQRELSVRAALGASRLTLARQLGTESLLLAAAGGALGLLMSQWGVRLLANYLPGYGETVVLTLTPDLRILAFTCAISVVTGVCFGLLPAWQDSRLEIATAAKEQGGSLLTREAGRVWNQALVVFQIALSCCLLIGAGLFVRTVQKLKAFDVGFNRGNLLAFTLDLGKRFDDMRQASLYAEILRRIEALPGVRSASFSSLRSMSGSEQGWGPTKVAAADSASTADEGLPVRGTAVGPGYFETLGIPLLVGRTFGPEDATFRETDRAKQAVRPVIIDQTSARRLFGDRNPVGKLMKASGRGTTWPPLEVIGVVGDVTHKEIRSGLRASIYGLETHRGCPFFYVRSFGSPLAVTGAIRKVMRDLNLEVELSGLQTMDGLVNHQLLRERTISQLAGVFSLLALGVACLGLYGILSYGVVRRTREIGVRMALGARVADVLWLVIRQGLTLTVAGCVVGAGLAVALTRFVASLLYGVSATDPLTFGGGILALTAVAVVASYLPARRAARLDPMAALRNE